MVLAGSVFHRSLPFVAGVGETVKVISTIDKVADVADTVHDAMKAADNAHDIIKTADNIADTASAVKKGWKVGDDITNFAKAGNVPAWSTVRQRHWKNIAYNSPELYPKWNTL